MNRSSALYQVFARLEATDPLRAVGTVRAPNRELARAYARSTYDEEQWIEMIAVPKDAIVPVIPGEDL